MASHKMCEMSPYLAGVLPAGKASDPHHIFGGAGRRVDCELNLLAVTRQAHIWAHANLKDSRVLGVWIKWKSGLFDADVFKLVSGKYIQGFLVMNEPSVPRIVQMWQELQNFFDDSESCGSKP